MEKDLTVMNKSLPAPNVPGNTEFEPFDNAVHAIMNVTKSVIGGRGKVESRAIREEKKRSKKDF